MSLSNNTVTDTTQPNPMVIDAASDAETLSVTETAALIDGETSNTETSVAVDEIIEHVNLPNSGLMYASIHDINRIMQLLSPVITNEKIINFILRIRQQNLRDLLCIEVFSKLLNLSSHANEQISAQPFDPQICKNLFLRVITVVLASPDADTEVVNKAFDRIDQIFDSDNDVDIKANAADIMLNYYPSRGERLLNILRAHNPTGDRPLHTHTLLDAWQNNEQDQGENLLNMIRANVHDNPRAATRQQNNEQDRENPEIGLQDATKSKILIYDDGQNVHNSALNASIVSACRSITNMMVTSVIFDGKYKIMVYEEDSIETIKKKLLSVLIDSGYTQKQKQIKIYGDNRKEQLQSKMTFELISSNSTSACKGPTPRFMNEDKYLYKNVMYHNFITFPEHIAREGKKGRLLEEAFIATNTLLKFVSEENEEVLPMYLFLTNIEDADIIWLSREEIRQELKQLIECPDVDNFVTKIQNHLFPFDGSKSKIFQKIRDGTFMEMDLHEILNAVWKFINKKENKLQGIHLQMIERLKDELQDAHVCCSGVAARLISSIQGFFDEDIYPSLKIKISIDDEMKAKINTLVSQKALVLEIDPLYDINEFKKIVNTVINENAESMMNEFTPQDVARNGINRENILQLAYDLYNIKD